MTASEFNIIRQNVRDKKPLIHSITNPISINQCANTVLALGARPMMAEHPKEVSSVTKGAGALLINLGNITDVRKKSMLISAKTAKKNNIPFCLDAVGVSASSYRRKFALKLIKKYTPDVIKGNYSEIKALSCENYSSGGVDADTSLMKNEIAEIAKKLASFYGTVILASGKTDIITDGKNVYYINNGTERLASVTGTGCMLGVMCTSFLSVSDAVCASVCAASVLGICGELSDSAKGSQSFMVSLLDNISTLCDDDFNKLLKLEEEKNEKF